MRGQEFHTRDRIVQKMTCDGLTQQNLTQGKQQRISSRVADISFTRNKPEDAGLDIRDGQQQKRPHQNTAVLQDRTGFQSGAEKGLTSGQKRAVQSADTAVPASYDAGDSLVMYESPHDAGSRQIMSDISQDIGRNISKKSCFQTVPANGKTKNSDQGTKIQPESGGMKVSIPDMGRGQLKFEPEKPREMADRSHASVKKRQAARFAADRARVEVSAQSESDRNKEAVWVTDHKALKYEPRLKFEPEEMGNTVQTDRVSMKKKQAAKFAAYGAGSSIFIEPADKEESAVHSGSPETEADSGLPL